MKAQIISPLYILLNIIILYRFYKKYYNYTGVTQNLPATGTVGSL